MQLLAAAVLSVTSLNYTCSPGSNESLLPFCDRSLSFEQRSADLTSRLSLDELLDYWGHSYPGTSPIDRYNVKSWSLDHSCTHGVNKVKNVSVFPHSLAQAASFDPELVSRIGNATMTEMRILAWQYYTKTHGANQGNYLSCDGGPMANTAHDPRWGRNSETYGEDPFLIATIGTAAMNALQGRKPFKGGSNDDEYYATRQTNTIYLGYHQANDLHPAYMYVSNRSLSDSYLRGYEALQRPDKGHADGIMCAMSSVNGVPPCGSEYFMKTILRDTWNSDALIQTDCCDSIHSMNSEFHFENITTDYEALKIAIDRGNVQVYFGFRGGGFSQDWRYHIGNGTLSIKQLQSSVSRIIKSQMRIGLFDTWSPDYPYKNSSFDWSLLDSSQHRQLAREAAGKTVVLLQNKNDVLPLQKEKVTTMFVTGPFADCQECYVHSYAGVPSYVTTLRDGLANSIKPPSTLTYSLGSNATCPTNVDDCWTVPGSIAQQAFQSAVAESKKSDIIVLGLGLGVKVESEGKDRSSVGLPPIQNALLEAIVKENPDDKQIIVVLVSGSGADFNTSGVTGILYAPYGGEEAGSGIADVLFGDVVPSARLPVTFYTTKWMTDAVAENLTMSHFDLDLSPRRTYRYATSDHVKYGFGFGLSYTKFSYTNLITTFNKQLGLVSVNFTVANIGAVDAAEVSQVYFTPPSDISFTVASINLVYFTKTMLASKTNVQLSADIPIEEFAISQLNGTRVLIPGSYTIHVGGNLPADVGTSGPSLSEVVSLE
eukprot:TRINITY_DN14037_c0_g1_i1.p1 TRINITY_DN14037_c0_g1~~TRINITY_DN14037_c0_g1_i1.p1  ORF type:complete len:768 (+),score=137.30 TRINITY_DN14037_c0_g1_i1:94-2397(+)